jgi:hypothetical protein
MVRSTQEPIVVARISFECVFHGIVSRDSTRS